MYLKIGPLIVVFFISVSSAMAQMNSNEIIDVAEKRRACIERMQPFPNPSMDGNFEISVPEGSSCQLVSYSGKVIGQWRVGNETLKINGVESGNYILLIQYGSEFFRRKVMVSSY